MIYLTQLHKSLNVLTINYISTQKEYIIMLYYINTVKINTEQINMIIKRITLNISVVHVIRQNTKYEIILVKFRSRRKIRLD